MTSNISIIIPTLNEGQNINALKPLVKLVREIIVVDGGSKDDTRKMAADLGFTVITSNKGRGTQLNHGAEKASSPLLLFLHADTILPLNFQHLVENCLEDQNIILGAFSLHIQTKSFLLQTICKTANLRSRFLQLPYGDQALFIRKTDFHALSGFPRIPIMEDYIFVKRAGKKGKIQTLTQSVQTSARRWQKLGIIQTTCINQLMIIGYHLGVPTEKLASFYRRGGVFRRR